MTDDERTVGRLVIIEDEPMIGRILEHKLRREGHDVHAATPVHSDAAAAVDFDAGPRDHGRIV